MFRRFGSRIWFLAPPEYARNRSPLTGRWSTTFRSAKAPTCCTYAMLPLRLPRHRWPSGASSPRWPSIDLGFSKPSHRCQTEVAVADPRIVREVASRARECHAPSLQNEGAIGKRKCMNDVLLDEDDRDTLLANRFQRSKDFTDEQRRQPER